MNQRREKCIKYYNTMKFNSTNKGELIELKIELF